MYDNLDPYRINPAIAPSDIKLYLDSTMKYKRIRKDNIILSSDKATSKAMDRGNAYDVYFSSPALFKEQYKVVSVKTPGEKVEAIVNELFDYCQDHLFNEMSMAYVGEIQFSECDLTYLPLQSQIEELVTKFDYQGNWKLETRIKDVISKGDAYFKSLIANKDYILISNEEYTKMTNNVDAIFNHPIIGPYAKTLRNPPDFIKVQYQHEIIYPDIKGKLDISVINEKTGRGHITDVKTAKNMTTLQSSFYTSGYYRQGSMYRELLQREYPNYQIEPTRFLVFFTDSEDLPVLIKMTEEHDQIARNGGLFDMYGMIEGWESLVEEIQWQENQGDLGFTGRREFIQNKMITTDFLSQKIITNAFYK